MTIQEFRKITTDNPKKLNEAISYTLESKNPDAWRYAWLINHVIEKNDSRLLKHQASIIKHIPTKGDGHHNENC